VLANTKLAMTRLDSAYLFGGPLNTHTLKCDVASDHGGHSSLNVACRWRDSCQRLEEAFDVAPKLERLKHAH